MFKGHTSSSVWMGVRVDRLVEIWFLDQISGPPVRCMSIVRRVTILYSDLATIEGYSGDPLLREWKANSKDLCRNLEAAPCR